MVQASPEYQAIQRKKTQPYQEPKREPVAAGSGFENMDDDVPF